MAAYDEIFAKLPDGITLHDPEDGSLLDANEQFCEMLGYTRDELLDEEFETVIPNETPYTMDQAQAYIRRAATEGPQTFEWRDETKAGETLPVEVHLRQTTIDDQERVLAVVRDITERKERERELERVREQMEFALDATDSFIWVLDLETGQTTNYGPVERLFGREPRGMDEFLGEVVHPEDAPQIRETFEAIRAGETGLFDLEFRTQPDDDTTKWISSTGYLRESDDGGERHVIGLATDVTDRRRRQETLERQNERLEEFAGVLSHDLRNPLNVAQGQLELARDECDSERLDTIGRAHDRMAELIENLLTLAREGKESVDVQSVALADLARECWAVIDTQAATLEIETDERIRADPARLRQALENLFGNAVEHGGDDVTVVLGRLEDGFYVADDGPGVPEADRERVFETGFSTTGSGTGMGLEIVREVAAAHGWTVEVTESEAGGARFEVTGVDSSEG